MKSGSSCFLWQNTNLKGKVKNNTEAQSWKSRLHKVLWKHNPLVDTNL